MPVSAQAASSAGLWVGNASVMQVGSYLKSYQAGANGSPALDASGAYARQDQSKNQPVLGNLPMPPGVHFNNNVYQAGFDASWEIDVFGGTRRAVEAGSAEVAAAELGRQNVLVTLLGEIRAAAE